MKILVFSWRDLAHPLAGGAEVYTHEVARQWVSQGHQVTLFASRFPGSSAEECRDGIRILRRTSGNHRPYWEARRFYASEGRGRFDLVIDQINTRPFWCPTFVDDAPVIALAYQVAREVWFYETPFPVALLGRFVFEPRWLKRYRDVPTVTLSQSGKESMERYGLRQVSVVPPGFTEPPRTAVSIRREDRPTVIYVGRLSRNKRPHHALRAFQHLRRAVPEAQLWMVGTGPMESRLRRRAGPAVTFFGKVDNATKYELLARSHVMVMTSVREGWGLTVTEAASVGTPTVGYDIDGLRDSIPVSGGFLTSSTPAALGSRLADLMEDLSKGGTMPVERVEPGGVISWTEVASSVLAAAPIPVG